MSTKEVTLYTQGFICECGNEQPYFLGEDYCLECYAQFTEFTGTYELEFTHEFPAKYDVCGCCQGTGTTYLGWSAEEQPAFTMEDMHEEGPDFYEDYMGGRYNKTCPKCAGKRVVLVFDVNPKLMSEKDKAIWEAYEDQLASDAYYDAIERAERRFGC